MLDLRYVRENEDFVRNSLSIRGESFDLDALLKLDYQKREILKVVEEKKSVLNRLSKEIPKLKKEGKDTEELLLELKGLSDEIAVLDEEERNISLELDQILLTIPNIPHADVPKGDTDEDNIELSRHGQIRSFDFEVKAHWDLGVNLGIIDFERGSKITGSRFNLLKGHGARLERALISLMLDRHTDNGYVEILPPYIVNREAMTGTGQLPKFEEDAFKLTKNDYFLIPTGEVPVTNMYSGEILDGSNLPIRHVAYSACFRSEAGSAGRDTRGLIRVHQFNKVELVKFVVPETSYDELDSLLKDAMEILDILELPYRVVLVCTGDLGFTAAKKYDIEVWMPSYNKYVEISSCSNFEDFQARRANIRFKPSPKEKTRFVHTINGSGLAIGRCMAAIMENYQERDGSITVPKALRPYMGGLERIE